MPASVTAEAFCELNEKGTRINVWFSYDAERVRQIKTISGRKFVPKADHPDGPFWELPKTMKSARDLREIFGSKLELGNAVKLWAREEVSIERNLGSLTQANDYPLGKLLIADVQPKLAKALRPYQRADVAMMAQANILNANQPGTGKTLEVLAALAESGMASTGPHLVIAPMRSLENVWEDELWKWLEIGYDAGLVFTAEDSKLRREVVEEGVEKALKGEPVWILVNPDMMRAKQIKMNEDGYPEPGQGECIKKDHKGNWYSARDPLHEMLLAVDWASVTIDEFHKSGLGNTTTLFKIGVSCLKSRRRYALSGTPMGGKPIKLFPVLQWLEPDRFTSKWRWAETWLEIESNGYGSVIEGLKPGIEEEFYNNHNRYMVRRLKREALPGLPPKQIIEVRCHMTPKQSKQYNDFARDAEIQIASALEEGNQRLATDCALAEFARLKQFANAYCELDADGKVQATEDSGKLPQLLERLGEFGIRPDKEDPEPGARAIVSSESKRMINMVAAWLTKQGIENGLMTGDTKDIGPVIDRFKDGKDKPYVICMTTQTGGVSLNLEEAGSIHILDETWSPDDQEQLEDRGDRGSRETSLMCLYYRTADTVQEYIAQTVEGKRVTNRNVLDVYRQIKASRGE